MEQNFLANIHLAAPHEGNIRIKRLGFLHRVNRELRADRGAHRASEGRAGGGGYVHRNEALGGC